MLAQQKYAEAAGLGTPSCKVADTGWSPSRAPTFTGALSCLSCACTGVLAMITRYPVVAVVGATLCLILGLRPSDAFFRAGFFNSPGHPATRARVNHAMLASATLSSDEAFTKLGNLLKDAQQTPNLLAGSISVSSRNADQRLVNFLDELKTEKFLTSWNRYATCPVSRGLLF